MYHVLCFCLLASLSTFLTTASADPACIAILLEPDGNHRPVQHPLDDPQPDTVRYDNGTPSLLIPSPNHWVRVRFTSPAEFELRSIYYLGNNPLGRTDPCSVFVYSSDAGELGDVLSSFPLPGPVVQFPDWGDVNLPQPVSFDFGEEFFVVMGPIAGGLQAQGIHVLLDNSPTESRSMAALNGGREGQYAARDGDLMIRAGGESAPFIDLAGESCFNEVISTGNPAFFVSAGEEILFKSRIRNRGNAVSTPFTLSWIVRNADGQTIFQDIRDVPGLAAGALQLYEAEQLFTPTQSGYLLVGCSATGQNDVRNENDTTWLRMSVGELNQWYRYDDNEEPDSYIGNSPGLRIGVSYRPVSYTASIDSLRVAAGLGTGDGSIRIYLNNDNGEPTETILWSQTRTLTEGWNTIPVNPPVLIYEGQSFTVAHVAVTAGFARDEDAPLASENTDMGEIAWTGTNSWQSTISGNYCMQAYLSPSTALPPWPLLQVSADTLLFGQVEVSGGENTIELTITNTGAQDTLVVSNIVVSPAGIRAAYSVNPVSVRIASGESQAIAIRFDPSDVRAYNGLLTITNNSHNEPSAVVIIRGEGVQSSPAGNAPEISHSFALSEAYPNPFNPATHLQFSVPVAGQVSLDVFDTAGRRVATLVNGYRAAGVHRAEFDASGLASGLYFARLTQGGYHAARKLVLLK